MAVTAYPLTWPEHLPRYQRARDKGAFKTTLAGALENVQRSLKLFAQDSGLRLSDVVISSNVTLGTNRPADPGVAVWFTWGDSVRCIPVDRYSTVEGNLQAIHHIIEARRVELRHGTLTLVKASMHGFIALAAPKGSQWYEVLEVPADAKRSDIEAAHRRLSMRHHPDRGGDAEKMAAINRARDIGLQTVT